jgi:predicted Holliday junction resolvase-like endonuclease
MSKAIAWIKKYGWIVLAAIGAVLAAILGVKHEIDKIEALKRQVRLSNLKADNAADSTIKEIAKEKEEKLREEEVVVEKVITEIEEKIKEVRNDVSGLSNDEVASRFNDLYGNSVRK